MFPRKAGSAWEIDAPAKLNLYLEVLGPPSEGFHPLETLMVPVRIYDQLSWSSGLPELSKASQATKSSQTLRCSLQVRNLSTSGNPVCEPLSTAADNLVLRAAHRLAEVAGVEPFGQFELVKRIPMQAGLGGGSSDAAAALLVANEGWGVGYSRQRLMQIAADIGSDVPYFLTSGAALCRGRGEIIEPVAGLPRLNFIVVKPPIGLATSEVFSKLQFDDCETRDPSHALSMLLKSLRQGAISEAGCWMKNRLESAAEQLTPWIGRLRQTFTKFGCHAHMMTGSGSSYVGIMRSARQARRVARQIACMKLGTVYATASC
jgi:4-diphosphocytidyl-2-C-methyl-D-erythritol kinase